MRLNYLIITLAFAYLLLSSLNVGAQPKEYFGEFSGEPSFKVKTNDDERPTFVVLEDFSFTDPNGLEWITPKDWEVDGASIPKFAWSFVGGPMSGKYIHASIIHDRYCDIKSRTAHDTHRNFYYGMKANGVSESKANVMYWAVRTFGPSWKVVKRAVRHRFVGPSKYRLTTVEVNAPKIPTEKIDGMLKQIKPEMTLAEIDTLSDSIRKDFGSEELQHTVPKLSPEERERTPAIDPFKRFFRRLF